MIGDPLLVAAGGNIGTSNSARGGRVVIQQTGILHDLSVFVSAQSGNLDLGIYDTSPTTRNRLYSSGSTAVAAINTWQSFDPNLAVTKGDNLDFVIACDNGTATFARAGMLAGLEEMPNSSFWTSPLAGGFAANGKMSIGWTRLTSFPLPSTVLESSLTVNSQPFFIIARIT